MTELPILLIAAGDSGRMERPKQLLPWGNKTLIEFQIGKLLNTGSPILVVLGAFYKLIMPYLTSYPVSVLVNKRWPSGMGGSINYGIRELEKSLPESTGVMISLVDQPLVPIAHYKKMVNRFHKGEGQIIATGTKSGMRGVPAIFDRCYFEELKKLDGDVGAREIIRNWSALVITMECEEMNHDIDTMESYYKVKDIFEKKLNIRKK